MTPPTIISIPSDHNTKAHRIYELMKTILRTNSQLHEFALKSHTRILPFWSPDINSVCKTYRRMRSIKYKRTEKLKPITLNGEDG